MHSIHCGSSCPALCRCSRKLYHVQRKFPKKDAGCKTDISYAFGENYDAGLAFTYHFPINYPSYVNASDGVNGKDVASEIKYNFKTISLFSKYYLKPIYDEETAFNAYGTFGLSYVTVNYKENVTGDMPAGYTLTAENISGNENGFTLNGGVGVQYKVGSVTPFLDANASFPSNNVNDVYYQNSIPAHFSFNLGIRISFGGGDY